MFPGPGEDRSEGSFQGDLESLRSASVLSLGWAPSEFTPNSQAEVPATSSVPAGKERWHLSHAHGGYSSVNTHSKKIDAAVLQEIANKVIKVNQD